MKTEYKVIATKISPVAYEQLQAIAAKANTRVYNLMQTVIDAYVKCCCGAEIATDYMREVVETFADFSKLKGGFCLLEPRQLKLQMSECFAIFGEKGKETKEIVLLEQKPDKLYINRNNDIILRTFMQAFLPSFLKKLECIMQAENLHTLTAALKYAINFAMPTTDTIHEEIRELFADNEHVDAINPNCTYKADREDIGKFKRKMGATMEDFERHPHRFIKDAEEIEPTDPLENYEPETIEPFEPLADYEPENIEPIDPLEEYEE